MLTVKQASSPPASHTWMVGNKVPWYWQGASPWCGIYSLAMVHQWWSDSSLGTGNNQAQEIADYADTFWFGIWDPNWGLTVGQVHGVMEDWPNVNPNYSDFQWTWYGEMKSLANSGSSYSADDIKGMIASDIPVIVATSHDAQSDFDHFVALADDDILNIANNGLGKALGLAVSGTGKLATTWSQIKNQH